MIEQYKKHRTTAFSCKQYCPAIMSVQAAYFEAQTRLTRWTDELEFLSYILCELIDAAPLNALGYRCHQAADLPALINVLRPHTMEHSGSLAAVMSADELQDFRRLMKKAKVIRNASAHHVAQTVDALERLEDGKRQFGNMLELAIKRVASDRAIHQVCPDIEPIHNNLLIRH
jgi:hypothetical protein